MIEITPAPIDSDRVLAGVACPTCGATVLFLGCTREFTDGRQTTHLEYEGYEPLARQELQRLEQMALARWPQSVWCVVHRIGRVDVGVPSVAVAVSTPHRGDAFEAGQWMIDRLKETVPIWKQEHWADGTSAWVHPGEKLPAEGVSVSQPQAGIGQPRHKTRDNPE